jgi:hypothetical protein
MRQALLVLAALSMVTTPAFSQACGDDGKYFHLKPPSYTWPSHRRKTIHKKARALRWYREHNGNVLVCPGSYIEGITIETSTTSTKKGK